MVLRSEINWPDDAPLAERLTRLPLSLLTIIGFKISYFSRCDLSMSERGFKQRSVTSLSLQDNIYFSLSSGFYGNSNARWFYCLHSFKYYAYSKLGPRNNRLKHTCFVKSKAGFNMPTQGDKSTITSWFMDSHTQNPTSSAWLQSLLLLGRFRTIKKRDEIKYVYLINLHL